MRGPRRSRPLRGQALWPEHAQRPDPAADSAAAAPERAPRSLLALALTRHGIPALIVLAGVVAMCFGSETSLLGGGGLIGAGAASWLVSWFYRLGVAGDEARGREERARAQFDATGRWPAA